jgi:hypothetical protein
MKNLLRKAALAAFFIVASVPAFGQNSGTVTNHAYAIGKGAGTTGYSSLLCASAQLAVGQAAADPICQSITGDITLSAGGVTAIGAAKVTSAMLGPDVYTTAHTWTGTQTFNGAVTFGGSVSGVLTGVTVAAGTAITVTGTCTITSSGTCTINLDKASQAQVFAATANKGMTSDNMWTSEIAVTYGATTTFDFSTFINSSVTLTGNITTQTLSNVKAGQAGQIRFIQDGTGSRTSVWNSIFKFAGGSTPTLSTTAAAIDVLFYSCVSTTLCYASLSPNMK